MREFFLDILGWTTPLVAPLLVCAALFIGVMLVIGYAKRPDNRRPPKHKKRGKHE